MDILKEISVQSQEVKDRVLMYLLAKIMIAKQTNELEIIIDGARIEIKVEKI